GAGTLIKFYCECGAFTVKPITCYEMAALWILLSATFSACVMGTTFDCPIRLKKVPAAEINLQIFPPA
ncbi:MAG: hypothetical protein ACI3W5_15745, partial [Faecousia sp.]